MVETKWERGLFTEKEKIRKNKYLSLLIEDEESSYR
jgi:hypothetical protein